MARRNRSFFFDNKSGKLESDGKVVVDASNTTNILQTKGSTTGNPVALNAIGDDTNITINIGPKGSGLVQISSAYTLPKNDGTNGQVLTTNGSGTLSFATASGGGTLGGSVDEYEFGDEGNQEIVDFMLEKSARLREISLRMVLKCADLRKMSPKTWKELAESTCMKRV